jgi:hypothetical protein
VAEFKDNRAGEKPGRRWLFRALISSGLSFVSHLLLTYKCNFNAFLLTRLLNNADMHNYICFVLMDLQGQPEKSAFLRLRNTRFSGKKMTFIGLN